MWGRGIEARVKAYKSNKKCVSERERERERTHSWTAEERERVCVCVSKGLVLHVDPRERESHTNPKSLTQIMSGRESE